MARNPRVPPVPPELVDRLGARECILFAGNGIAIEAGYPGWNDILRRLVKVLETTQPGHIRPSRLLDLVRQGEVELAAELLQANLPKEVIAQTFTEIYQAPPQLTSPHFLIGSLPFAGFLLAGWDDTLETLLSPGIRVVDWAGLPEFSDLLNKPERFLVRLMGSTARPESFIFSIDEYRKLLRTNEPFLKFLTHLYSSYTFLFVGARISSIESFVEDLAVWGGLTRRHFALIEEYPDLDLRAARLSARFGIEVLPYQPSPGHPEVEQFLKNLYERITPEDMPLSASGSPQIESTTLDRIILENIGPFERLDLDLGPEWNVLLGNNGCGKSTILRAIALGFCGDDPQAQEAASRLLRSGASSGSIELHVGSQRFVTQLSRRRRTVRAHSAALTPLQAGRSVILGFPALRGATQANPSGPTPGGISYPEVTDLLPLLHGQTDFRLDGAKQWIVNTQLRAERVEELSPEEIARHARMLGTYFAILRDLTSGVDFRFSRIDRQTWQVFVTTPDGEIPIDSLSQGTNSILGWVGALLQRMFEIHGSSTEPENEPALVLVDEIDAHMHPEWQQNLVPLLKKHFRQLQVIATSHSPLVVGNLGSSEVLHVRRDAESQRVQVARLNVSFQGWRADQILTGPAFDLETTVAARTRQLMEEYTRLLGRTDRNADEERRLADLTRTLRAEIPSHPETPERREALRLLEEFLHGRLREQSAERRERIVAEARDLFAEIDALEATPQ